MQVFRRLHNEHTRQSCGFISFGAMSLSYWAPHRAACASTTAALLAEICRTNDSVAVQQALQLSAKLHSRHGRGGYACLSKLGIILLQHGLQAPGLLLSSAASILQLLNPLLCGMQAPLRILLPPRRSLSTSTDIGQETGYSIHLILAHICSCHIILAIIGAWACPYRTSWSHETCQ